MVLWHVALVLVQLAGAATCWAFSFLQLLTGGLDREIRPSLAEKASISSLYLLCQALFLDAYTCSFTALPSPPIVASTLTLPELQAPRWLVCWVTGPGCLGQLPHFSLSPSQFCSWTSVWRFWSSLAFLPLLWELVSCQSTGGCMPGLLNRSRKRPKALAPSTSTQFLTYFCVGEWCCGWG